MYSLAPSVLHHDGQSHPLMAVTRFIGGWKEELAAVRQDLHAHPELGFEEHRTARVITQGTGFDGG